MNLLFPSLAGNRRAAWAVMLAITAMLIALPIVVGWSGAFWVRVLAMGLLYVMLALGLNIVVGFAGLLDLGYVAFYAIGAYLYALLASPHLAENFEWFMNLFPNGLHVSFWLVIPLALLAAALFGVLLGAPVLKLRGDYLAIVTLGFGEIIRIFMNNLNSPVNITNGPQGIGSIDPISIFGFPLSQSLDITENFSLSSVQLYYYLFLALTVLTVIVCVRLQDSRVGRAWMAIREDEIAARAMGINTTHLKLLAFALGASFGGVSGAMFGAFQRFVSPESFILMESVGIISMVVLGGMGHIPGVILGAMVLYAIPEALRMWARPAQEFLFGSQLIAPEALRMLLFGAAMVLIMLFRPAGLWPVPRHGRNALDEAGAAPLPAGSKSALPATAVPATGGTSA